jgi:hypothetical protein
MANDKTKALQSIETLGTTPPTTQRHILEDLHLQEHYCDSHKTETRTALGVPLCDVSMGNKSLAFQRNIGN